MTAMVPGSWSLVPGPSLVLGPSLVPGPESPVLSPRSLVRAGLLIFIVALVLGVTPAPAVAQESHVLVITGASGDEEHAKQFHGWAATFIDAARTKDNVPEANITYLGEKPESNPSLIRGRSARENVEKAIADIAAKAQKDDQVVILLIGHGTFDGSSARFNLPGPDLSAEEWSALLKKLAAQKVAFINTSASSGAFLPAIAAPGRTIVTATKTGGERNEPRFGEFIAAAFGDAAADADRNGHVSVLEAFNYADNKVAQVYKQAGLLRTEHATIDDGGEGKLAGTQFLTARPSDGGIKVDTSDPAMAALVAEREAIQKEIDALRLKKDGVDQARYDQDMERLLTNLALKTREIRELEAQTAKKATKP
jgi:hypothetical protein